MIDRDQRTTAEKWLKTPSLHNFSDPLIVIAMSGGVDSSVAALKIKEAGFRCSALFIKSWNDSETSGMCHWETDVADALDVCERLDIPLNTIDLTEEYWDLVFQEFLVQIAKGKTPNPDILCNKEIKFNALKIKARELGADVIATGHYAKIQHHSFGIELRKAADKNKDQSYFLYSLRQDELSNVVFPLGESEKQETRKLARSYGLKTHNKKDSTGICFIGKRKFRSFLAQYVAATNGPIVDTEDRVIGEHKGAVFYTIGQRKGLGIGGTNCGNNNPWYVVDKILFENKLVVGQGSEHPYLLSNTLIAGDVSWVLGPPSSFPFTCSAKIRYRQADQPCEISEMPTKQLKVVFRNPQRAITPGQSIVFYSGDTCLGGALIEEKTVYKNKTRYLDNNCPQEKSETTKKNRNRA